MSDDRRIALVTGASGPLGQAIIGALSADAAVVGASRTEPDGGAHALFIRVDTTDEASLATAMDEIGSRYGRLDIVVANAGATTARADFDDLDLDEWRRVVDVNVTGTFMTLRAAAPLLRRSPSGRVVSIASVAGLQPLPRMAAYATSKSALVGLTKAAARELAPHCTVNAIAPGYLDDGMANAVLADTEYRRFVLERTPLARLGTLAEVGALVRFLCSADAGFITGQLIAIDGGWTLV